MKVLVPAERVEREVEQRLKSLGKRAKLNGFRPGKIPYDVVKKRFGNEIRQEVVGELLRDTCNEAFQQEKVYPAGGPRIDSVNSSPGMDLEFTATFEVYPEIQLNGTEDLQLERPAAEITAADIDAMVENLRQQRAEWIAAGRGARKGDRIQLDFNGSISGVEFPGSRAEKVYVVLGENRMLADFEQGLDGIKPGEARQFEVHFPADYHVQEVAGKTAQFSVHTHQVESRKLPELDEAFCKSFGVAEGGIEKLRMEVAENMRREMDEAIRKRMKQQVLDKLLEANPLQLPNILLESEIESMRRESLERLGSKDGKGNTDLPRELFEDSARRRVSLGLILGEVIKQQQLRVDAKRVQERLERMAGDYSNPSEAMRSMRSNAAVMHQIESLVLEDQVVDKLLEKAKTTDKPTSFQELMHFNEHPHDHAHD
ncbi:MAG: trigger factor [Gammaproteobacteria bacterium]|nr:trigger factor [Gammaproteobacteria bacterium]